jgi:hypothetical protein
MKTQRNFKMSDESIEKLDTICEFELRNRTKEIEHLINTAFQRLIDNGSIKLI